LSNIKEITDKYARAKGTLIPILQEVQQVQGYLSEEAIAEISELTRIPKSEIFGVASFYSQFYFTRRGKYSVKVCLGTACHVRGGQRILDEVQSKLGILPGETSENYEFSLDKVACFGSCALAPVTVIDKTVYGRMSVAKVKNILDLYQHDNK
jgi:NADH-quinone oxidoreductase subunit E